MRSQTILLCTGLVAVFGYDGFYSNPYNNPYSQNQPYNQQGVYRSSPIGMDSNNRPHTMLTMHTKTPMAPPADYLPPHLRRSGTGNGSFFESENKRYYLEYRYVKYRDVKDYCQDMNMTMIRIKNWRENVFVRDLDNRNMIPLGVDYRDGRWLWDDGSELTYTNWEDWEPRCGTFCNTIYMKLSGRWFFDQENVLGIIGCEKELPEEEKTENFPKQILKLATSMKKALDVVKHEMKKVKEMTNEVDKLNLRLPPSNRTTRINP